MSAPTFVAEYETAWDTADAKSTSVTVAAGNVLVLVCMSLIDRTTFSPSGGGLTWTLRQSISSGSKPSISVFTAVAAAAQTFTLSVGASNEGHYGFNCLRFSGSNGVGVSAKKTASGAPSLALTTTGANSAIVCGIADWISTGIGSRTWRTINSLTPTSGNGRERTAFTEDPLDNYRGFIAYWEDCGSTGSKTAGMTAPDPQDYAAIAIEVLGTPTTSKTGAGSTTVNVTQEGGALVEFPSNRWTRVELYYDDKWNDITQYVYQRNPIQIERGQGDGLASIRSFRADLSISNRTHAFSPRNTSSPLHGKIGRNTRLRISFYGYVRFTGEVESWPQAWTIDASEDGTRGDVWAPITAWGITRRLDGAGTKKVVKSAVRRAVEAASPAPFVYWACDGGGLSASAQVTVGSGTPLIPTQTSLLAGRAKFGSADLAPWLGPGLQLSDEGATFTGVITGMTGSPTRITLDWCYTVDFTDDVTSASYAVTVNGAENNRIESAIYSDGAGTYSVITLGVHNGSSVISDVSSVKGLAAPGVHYLRVDVQRSGSNTVWATYLDGTEVASGTVSSNTQLFKSYTVAEVDFAAASNGNGRVVIGHCALYVNGPADMATILDSVRGHAGEMAHARIERVCGEEGIPVRVTTYHDPTLGPISTELGPQPTDSVLGILRDAADAEVGILVDSRDTFGVDYITFYGQLALDATATLDYAAKEVQSMQAVEDTTDLANDVTVTRLGGGSYQAVKTTGPLNIHEPVDDPEGVGRYAVEFKPNLYSDFQVQGWAEFLLERGTVDQPRFPVLEMNLTKLGKAGKGDLVAAIAAADVGRRIVVENPPEWIGTDDVDQLVRGYTETMVHRQWKLSWSTTPYAAYETED